MNLLLILALFLPSADGRMLLVHPHETLSEWKTPSVPSLPSPTRVLSESILIPTSAKSIKSLTATQSQPPSCKWSSSKPVAVIQPPTASSKPSETTSPLPLLSSKSSKFNPSPESTIEPTPLYSSKPTATYTIQPSKPPTLEFTSNPSLPPTTPSANKSTSPTQSSHPTNKAPERSNEPSSITTSTTSPTSERTGTPTCQYTNALPPNQPIDSSKSSKSTKSQQKSSKSYYSSSKPIANSTIQPSRSPDFRQPAPTTIPANQLSLTPSSDQVRTSTPTTSLPSTERPTQSPTVSVGPTSVLTSTHPTSSSPMSPRPTSVAPSTQTTNPTSVPSKANVTTSRPFQSLPTQSPAKSQSPSTTTPGTSIPTIVSSLIATTARPTQVIFTASPSPRSPQPTTMPTNQSSLAPSSYHVQTSIPTTSLPSTNRPTQSPSVSARPTSTVTSMYPTHPSMSPRPTTKPSTQTTKPTSVPSNYNETTTHPILPPPSQSPATSQPPKSTVPGTSIPTVLSTSISTTARPTQVIFTASPSPRSPQPTTMPMNQSTISPTLKPISTLQPFLTSSHPTLLGTVTPTKVTTASNYPTTRFTRKPSSLSTNKPTFNRSGTPRPQLSQSISPSSSKLSIDTRTTPPPSSTLRSVKSSKPTLILTTTQISINDTFYSETEVRCNSGDQSEEPYRLVDMPYACEVVTTRITSGELLLRIKSYVLSALADGILSCETYPHAVEAYSLSGSSLSNHEYNCSDSTMHNCSIVEGKLTLKVEGGTDIDDIAIMDEANTAVNQAFIELDDQGVLRVKYIGNDTVSMSRIDQYRQSDGRSFTSNSLIIAIACSLFVGAVLFALLRSICCRATTARFGYRTL